VFPWYSKIELQKKSRWPQAIATRVDGSKSLKTLQLFILGALCGVPAATVRLEINNAVQAAATSLQVVPRLAKTTRSHDYRLIFSTGKRAEAAVHVFQSLIFLC
jgi:hypothetical protein